MDSHHYDGAILIAPKSESSYFLSYRLAFPEEKFLSFTYEEVCALFEYEAKEGAEDYLRRRGIDPSYLYYLKKMVGHGYKSPDLNKLEPLVQGLLSAGLFVTKGDPSAIFCGKVILIRGYYAGRMIAEALQDLPNISLNWDLGFPRFGEQKTMDLQASFASCAKYLSDVCNELPSRDNVYLRYEGTQELPSPLSCLKRLHGPFAPMGAKVLYLEQKQEEPAGEDLLDEKALAELHLVGKEERKRRAQADEERFLSHPSLYARVFAIEGEA